MQNIVIAADTSTYDLMPQLQQSLSDAGLLSDVVQLPVGVDVTVSSMRMLERAPAVVGVLNELNHFLLASFSYLVGKGKVLCLLSSGSAVLPLVLRSVPVVSTIDADWPAALASHLRRELHIAEPSPGFMRDTQALVQWLSEDSSRLETLSSQTFEQLIFALINETSIAPGFKSQRKDEDTVLCTADDSYRFLVQCKSYPMRERIGLKVIEQALVSAIATGCSFTLLVSPNDITPEAAEFARSCAPPVWFGQRQWIERLLRSRLQASLTAVEDSPGLLSSILSSEVSGEMDVMCHLTQATRDHSAVDWLRHWRSRSDTTAPTKLGSCNVFVTHRQDVQSGSQLSAQCADLVRRLVENKVSVWHDSPFIDAGKRCTSLRDVAQAGRQCNLVLYFAGHGSGVSIEHMKVLETLASHLNRRHEPFAETLVIGQDDLWNRLSIPVAFCRSRYLGPLNEDLKLVILSACESFINPDGETINGMLPAVAVE